jgi:hypothetical protein
VARAWIRCGINQPAFDHLTPTDGRLEAMVWTFGELDLGDERRGDCAAVTADGGLESVPCTGSGVTHVACRTATGALELRHGAAGQACGSSGHFDVPRNGREAHEVGLALAEQDTESALVALTFIDGQWEAAG